MDMHFRIDCPECRTPVTVCVSDVAKERIVTCTRGDLIKLTDHRRDRSAQ